MRNKSIAAELKKLLDSEMLDRDEEKAVRDAISLLTMSTVTVLAVSYKRGFLDGIAQRATSNYHKVAEQNANAYALEVLRANEKLGA